MREEFEEVFPRDRDYLRISREKVQEVWVRLGG